jgi:hypothetical protein
MASHSRLVWVSIGLLAACAGFWMVLGKTVLIINGAGVRCESILGQQEMAWEEIVETRYRVVPVKCTPTWDCLGQSSPCPASQAVRNSTCN